jgi:hypothetical protein
MNMRAVLLSTSLVGLLWLGASGCSAASKTSQPSEKAAIGLPGITKAYAEATRTHRRAVRKPVRDAQARSMRALADNCDVLLAESASWDSDARLVSIAEGQRSPARAAVADFRSSLTDLKAAAKRGNRGAVRADYAKLMTSYRRLNEITSPIE